MTKMTTCPYWTRKERSLAGICFPWPTNNTYSWSSNPPPPLRTSAASSPTSKTGSTFFITVGTRAAKKFFCRIKRPMPTESPRFWLCKKKSNWFFSMAVLPVLKLPCCKNWVSLPSLRPQFRSPISQPEPFPMYFTGPLLKTIPSKKRINWRQPITS